ncbi:MAG: DUF4344 domain-containing metallopeptidase [Alphaproteobacteria bacterium]
MTYRISYRTNLAGAMAVAALMINVPAASAQPTSPPAQPAAGGSQILAGIDDAVKALDGIPRFKKLSPQMKRQLVEFIIGNTLFVLSHEMGHGVINEMNMPVLGREEDAADSFAITTAIRMNTKFSERVLEEQIKGLLFSTKQAKKEGDAPAFYDEHGLDPQRAYNIVCYMYGSDPKKYKQLAKDSKLPEERQESCVWDYKNVAWSWDEMLKPHLRKPDQPKVDIKINYVDSKKYAVQQQVLRHTGLFEALAAHLADRYAWPNPFVMEARECGEANARWRQRTLTLCYELAGDFADLFQGYWKTLPKRYREGL